MSLPPGVLAIDQLERIEHLTNRQWEQQIENDSISPDAIYMTPFEGHHIITMPRTPTQNEIDNMVNNTLIFVYNPETIIHPDAADEGG